MNVERFSYRVVEIRPLSDYVSQILLTPTSAHITYEAGQYVNVVHDEHTVSSLSIACAPNQHHGLEFHLFHPKENVLANHLVQLAKEKRSWEITEPFGDCTVSRIIADKPIIFLARGTGFAPIKAMIEAMLSLSHPPMSFYWSMPQESHFYLLDLLEHWAATVPNFSFVLISQDKDVAKPFTLMDTLSQQHTNLSECQVYSSGSPVFVRAVFSALRTNGLTREFFYSDVELKD